MAINPNNEKYSFNLFFINSNQIKRITGVILFKGINKNNTICVLTISYIADNVFTTIATAILILIKLELVLLC